VPGTAGRTPTKGTNHGQRSRHDSTSIADYLSQHGEATITDLCAAIYDGKGRTYDVTVGGRSVVRDALNRVYRAGKVQRRSVTGPKTAVFHYAPADAEPDGDGWMTYADASPVGRAEMAARLAEAEAKVQAAEAEAKVQAAEAEAEKAAAVDILMAEVKCAELVLSR
jgi:hypothetical protein